MPKLETISSESNPLVKEVRQAIVRGRLTSQGWCVAETVHLLGEALRSKCRIECVLAAESMRDHVHAPGIKVTVLPDALLQKISGTETSPGVITLVEPPTWTLAQIFTSNSLIVVLDGLQDPGNVGAILRTAEAFGATGALFLKGTASPFNSKTLRASAGSLFRVPFLWGMDAALALATMQEQRVPFYAAVPWRQGVRAASDVDLATSCAFVIGNEARGVSPEFRAAARQISIPTLAVESLNAAMAAGILLYEARRQRGASR